MNEQNNNELHPYIIEGLSDIQSKPVRRRLTRELTELQLSTGTNMIHVQSVELNEKGIPIVTIVDYTSENANIYEFNTKDYPFRVPTIKINYSPYTEFLKIRTQKFNELLKKIKGLNCLCCNSYICSDKWTPALRLTNIIDEIRTFRKYRRDIINKFYADKIKDKYLISDIDLDSWLF